MPTNIDYREIIQTVTQQVTTDITNRLNTIKPAIQNEIAEAVRNSLNQALQPQLDSICSRLDALEQLAANPSSTSLLNQINDLQKRFTKLEQLVTRTNHNVNNTVLVPSSSVPSIRPVTVSANRISMGEIKYWQHKKIRGWVFYQNKDEGDCLYMVREDGTDNKQLTNYSISIIQSVTLDGTKCTVDFCGASPTYTKHTITVQL